MKRVIPVFIVAVMLLAIGGTATALAEPNAMLGGGTVTGTVDSTGVQVLFGTALNCDKSQLPTSLVLRWDGNIFILQEAASISCSGASNPPAPPTFELSGDGTGILINEQGIADAHIIFSLFDGGGLAETDTLTATIHDTSFNTLLSVDDTLDSGNLLATTLLLSEPV